jgi:hypothetical protein
LIGHVDPDGHVYESRAESDDKHVGHVVLKDGKVYVSRLGPDAYLGYVDLHTGKVFVYKPSGSDEHVGDVRSNGRMYHPAAPDEHVAEIKGGEPTFAHMGGAYLLLVLARVEEKEAAAEEEREKKESPASGMAGDAARAI